MNTRARLIGLVLTAVVLAGVTPALTAEYEIDEAHSAVTFQVKHMTISKVKGSFGDFVGTFNFTEDQPASWQVNATIQIASVDTGNQKRDEHLRGDDFFDAAKYPTMVFKSTGVKMANATEGKLLGELTMHGVTKTIELDLEYNGSIIDPWGNERAGFSVTGKIKRKNWGLSYNSALEAGGLAIGEDVQISLEIEGIKAK